MSALTPKLYQQPILGTIDPLLQRCLTIATGLALILLLVVLITPLRVQLMDDVEEVPERFAKLILEKPVAPPVPAADVQVPNPTSEPKEKEPEPAPEVKAETPPPKPAQLETPRRAKPKPIDADKGQLGREKAKAEVSSALKETTASLEKSLSSLSTSLTQTKTKREVSARKGRGAKPSARGTSQLAQVADAPSAGGGVATGGTGSQLRSDLLSVETVGGTGKGSSASGRAGGRRGGRGKAGGAEGSYRTNASLLAVVKRYSAGIEFCYDNELKKSPGLRGKLVVAITVLASGRVSDVKVVSNSLGSGALSQCAVSQIKGWKFPAIPEGTVTFQTPFVFTPPK
ncbi:MAG: TonB family protein [Candidatus Eisenbacteria bacterium]|uniref:TonB family protein n=1 Tax=Eiseniibacteriota bacterium TaxID=2212470 RepID=A0A7Y2E7K1_UNCEI|nr:TonB family protein [Candidatus Eisenbacteria bacterium]